MKSRRTLLVVAAVLAVLILPVVLQGSGRSVDRILVGTSLSQLDYQEVEFRNQQQGLDLAGMLFLPEGEGPFPAVVIIHGSGYSHRDNSWYLTLTDHLQGNGIAVLLPDKRGSERSEGDWKTASLEDLAADTAAAVDYLLDQEGIAFDRIGIIGMSQGGMIAPIVAAGDTQIDFLVNVVGGAVPMHRGLVYEEKHNLREMGFLPGVSDLLAYPAAGSLIYFRQAEFWGAVGNFDPLPYWEQVQAPSLTLYGAEDTNVPTQRSARRLQSLNQENIQIVIYPGSGHALEYPLGSGNSIFREDALAEITSFVTSR